MGASCFVLDFNGDGASRLRLILVVCLFDQEYRDVGGMERRVEGFGLPESRIIPVVDPRQRIGLGGLLLLASIAGICCDDGVSISVSEYE